MNRSSSDNENAKANFGDWRRLVSFARRIDSKRLRLGGNLTDDRRTKEGQRGRTENASMKISMPFSSCFKLARSGICFVPFPANVIGHRTSQLRVEPRLFEHLRVAAEIWVSASQWSSGIGTPLKAFAFCRSTMSLTGRPSMERPVRPLCGALLLVSFNITQQVDP